MSTIFHSHTLPLRYKGFLFAIFSTLISYIVVSLEIFSSKSANRITEVLLENLAELFRVYGLKIADALGLSFRPEKWM